MRYTFIKYQNMHDVDDYVYALHNGTLPKMIDGVEFLEVTRDFKSAKFMAKDKLVYVEKITKDI